MRDSCDYVYPASLQDGKIVFRMGAVELTRDMLNLVASHLPRSCLSPTVHLLGHSSTHSCIL